jgi:subtilisin family serine protease
MIRRAVFVVLSTLMLTALLGASSFAQNSQVLDFKPGEVIVGYRTEADRRTAESVFKSAPVINGFSVLGGQATPKLEVSPHQRTSLLLKFSLPSGKNAFADGDPASQRRLIDDLASQIKKMDPRVKYVYPNYLLSIPDQKPISVDETPLKKPLSAGPKLNDTPPNSFPNDPSFTTGLQWDYQALPMGMNAVGAWKVTTGDRRIVVAVVDSGILRLHPDVVGSGNLLPGYNFVSDGAGRNDDPSDTNDVFHGSNVASIIGAVATNNKLDVAGINWMVSVLPVRVANEAGGSSSNDLADGILWAAGLPVEGAPRNNSPADVINLSLGASGLCDNQVRIKDAIAKARSAGSVVVVAAGNSSEDFTGVYPANCPGVISVAAHNFRGHLASYSNFGNVSIVAPGGEGDRQILGIAGAAGTQALSGTSQAAPHVAGAIALAMAKHEEWRRNPDLIAAAVHDSAVPMPAGACSHPCGPGQLDAQKLLEYVPSTAKPPATAAVAPPKSAGPASAKVSIASASRGISGRWLMAQGGVLVIDDDEWFHPTKGTAIIQLTGKDLVVRYPQQIGVTCAYRATASQDGTSLDLVSTNALQPEDYCPVGRLTPGP